MIYSVEIVNKELLLKNDCEETTFKEWGLIEENLGDFVCKHPEVLFDDEESCILVGRHAVDENKGINDLMAIDGEGNLILIELKRDKKDMQNRAESLEFQAIRYCASLASITNPEELISASFAKYIEYCEPNYNGELSSHERARKQLNEFLIRNNCLEHFNQKQKIILVASDFDQTTLSACAWMLKNGIDIKLIKIAPVEIGDKRLLNVETLMPSKDESEYFTSLIKHNESLISKDKRLTRTNKPRMAKLMEWGIVFKGMKLYIKGFDPDEFPDKIAEVIDSKTVKYGNREISFNKWGCEVTSWSSICIYEWAIEVGKAETLDELRNRKQLEEENA